MPVHDLVVDEKDGTANFMVTLGRQFGQSSNSTITVDFTTASGTAVAGSDFTATSGTLVFLPGQSVKTVSVPLIDDATAESLERFFLNLSNASNAVITNDTLNGGLGVDRMEGGPGDDVYAVDNVNDIVIELPGEGTDRVSSTVHWTLGANVENLTLAGTAAINGTGNSLPNVITGNPAANAIDGGAGDDTLSGGEGNDTLTGGAGSDRLTGGPGADVFRFVTTGDGPDVLTDFARGTDRIAVVAANFGLVAGQAANVLVNGSAVNGAAVFLYTSASGLLQFDRDGNGPLAPVSLATLSNRPNLLAPSDFILGS